MAELTSMLSSVCQRFDFTAPQLSLPLLFQNNETLNSSPVDHTSSLPAHSRSCRRSAPPAFHSPLQFNRLDFHLIPAEKTLTHFFTVNLTQVSLSFLLGSHSNSDFSCFRFLFFPFSIYSNNRTHLLFFSSGFLSCSIFFLHTSLLILPVASSPSPPSAT